MQNAESELRPISDNLSVTPLKEEVDPKYIFPLLLTYHKRIFYYSDRRIIYVNRQPKGEVLTKHMGLIYTELLRHPGEIRPYADFYRLFYPESKENTYSKYEVGEIMRPTVFRLHARLEDIDERLSKSIWTSKGQGWVYIPHESIELVFPSSLKVIDIRENENKLAT